MPIANAGVAKEVAALCDTQLIVERVCEIARPSWVEDSGTYYCEHGFGGDFREAGYWCLRSALMIMVVTQRGARA